MAGAASLIKENNRESNNNSEMGNYYKHSSAITHQRENKFNDWATNSLGTKDDSIRRTSHLDEGHFDSQRYSLGHK
jgi:hypothetical protein